MKVVEAYLTADGGVFADCKKALEHEDDLIGAELNEIFKLCQLVDNIEHQAIYNAVIFSLRDKAALLSICKNIVKVLEFKEGNNDIE